MSLRICTLPPIDQASHTHTVVFLHGRNVTATQFADDLLDSRDARGLSLQHIFPSVKWVFPEAPPSSSSHHHHHNHHHHRHAEDEVATTSEQHQHQPQWFDIWTPADPDEGQEQQRDGLRESVAGLVTLILDEAERVGGLHNVVLAGISQGCAVAVHALLNFPTPAPASSIPTEKGEEREGRNDRLGAFVGLSGWMSLGAEEAEGSRSALGLELDVGGQTPEEGGGGGGGIYRNTPVFLSHSANDNIVPVAQGRRLRDTLVRYGMDVRWREYERGGHWLYAPQGVEDIVAFLREQGLERAEIADT
ncbi:phospholipase/carboxylesterase family protein [Whalleya microplaca]|nr:phospholipase/carboxylesterase family protein [Whalleya microplaca]